MKKTSFSAISVLAFVNSKLNLYITLLCPYREITEYFQETLQSKTFAKYLRFFFGWTESFKKNFMKNDARYFLEFQLTFAGRHMKKPRQSEWIFKILVA